MADFVQALDPAKLVLVETVSDTQLWVLVDSAFLQFLSFVTSAFDAPVYNLPLFLFGTYAQESAEAVQSSQTVSHRRNITSHSSSIRRVQFTVLLGASIIYDIVWMARHEQSWFIRMVTIIIQILKVRMPVSSATKH